MSDTNDGGPAFLIIDLHPITAECVVCGDVSHKQGIPMHEDIVLPNDWGGEWGGQPACPRCFSIQEQLTRPISLAAMRTMIKERTKHE